MSPLVDPFESFRSEVLKGSDASLDRLAFLIPACGTGWLDFDYQIGRLDDLAEEFGGTEASELMGWMAIRGFRGNAKQYYDPDNSFLNRVIDRGLGIPISLSVLAIEVGRRCGIELVGIGLPTEFIVAERDNPDRFHNPFRRRSMTPDDVAQLILRVAGADTVLTPAMRAPVAPTAIAARMLANLAHIYAQTDQLLDLEWVLRLAVSIPGVAVSVRRQFVSTLARRGRFLEATEVLVALMADGSVERSADERNADNKMLRQLRGNLN